MTTPIQQRGQAPGWLRQLRQSWRSLVRRPANPLATAGGEPPARVRPAICNDLRSWCALHPEARYEPARGRQGIERRLPRTIEPVVDPDFYALLTYEAPERALVSIAGAQLVGPNGLMALPDGSFVGETVALTPTGRQNMLEQEPAYYSPLPRPARRLDGQYVLLMVIGWENYYHWNHDVVMRMQPFAGRLPTGARYVVPGNLQPFHLASLEAVLGITPDQLLRFDGSAVWEFEQLSFASPIYKTQIEMPEPLEWFRDRSQRAYGVPAGPARRRIYLTRKPELDTHYRVTNAVEVEACLAAHGFEAVFPGDLSFREQVELFSQAESVAGTGTGLANMVFAPQGAKILQIQEPSQTVVALWVMADALGHEYWYFHGQSVPNPGQSRPDIFVPLSSLEAALKAMWP